MIDESQLIKIKNLINIRNLTYRNIQDLNAAGYNDFFDFQNIEYNTLLKIKNIGPSKIKAIRIVLDFYKIPHNLYPIPDSIRIDVLQLLDRKERYNV